MTRGTLHLLAQKLKLILHLPIQKYPTFNIKVCTWRMNVSVNVLNTYDIIMLYGLWYWYICFVLLYYYLALFWIVTWRHWCLHDRKYWDNAVFWTVPFTNCMYFLLCKPWNKFDSAFIFIVFLNILFLGYGYLFKFG